MAGFSSPHVPEESLRQYVQGNLDACETEAIVEHLRQCGNCLSRLEGLAPPDFVAHHCPTYAAQENCADRTIPLGSSPTLAESAGDAGPAGRPDLELASHPDYEIIRELGRGGMGVVYLAHNKLMGRREVLKALDNDITKLPAMQDRFLREIRAVARLRHPNIVAAYSAFRSGENLVLAMEYVEGLDLARMVKAKGPMPVGHACYFGQQAALALQHAHEEGMVHRDIKPGNLMLSHARGRPLIKVLDFGLAKANRELQSIDLRQADSGHVAPSGSELTLAGQFLGTPEYVARTDRRRPECRHPG